MRGEFSHLGLINVNLVSNSEAVALPTSESYVP